jgi:mono/diheme cytochrome c family protein
VRVPRRDRARLVAGLGALALAFLPGCWEQWSESWFPQMKWQKTVQAYERVEFQGRVEGFLPPDGAVPVDGGEAPIGRLDVAALDALKNPTDPNDFRSLDRGEQLYGTYCRVCHGDTGLGDGPVSNASVRRGPFSGVYPLVGLTTGRSDGYIYNVIKIGNGGVPGFRMPAYGRIPAEDRWHLVNYVRYLVRKGGRP